NVSVNDGRYAIVKNMSPKSGTLRNARRQPNCSVGPALAVNDPLNCNFRMFGGYWYVDGDHSGTTNAIGNLPPDANTPSGYMLEVNADYVASEVYRQTLTNLCPSTYYEFSAWVRNICTVCGIDSLGQQFKGTATAPANGYPGVLPNLTFALDSLDYYNSGEIDTVGWIKKGFVFKTGPSQTTATFSIRNNAQGGGGNDWTLDDIAIATCLPSMAYSPTINPIVCQGNPMDIRDTVTSFFNNYTNFKWQRSTDAGNNWTDITTAVDTTLTQIGSTYQFITKYTVPPAFTTPANNNDLYRVIVATSNSNLSNSACLYTDASTIITLSVINCGPPLNVDLLSFSGKLNSNKNAELLWVTSKEDEPVFYSVEKSLNGTSFNSIAMITGHGSSNETNYYQFTDPSIVTSKVWYRIAIVNKDGKKKYSRVILLEDKTNEFGFTNVINPFSNEVDFEISAPQNSRIEATLINLSGNIVKKYDYNVYEGSNNLTIPDTGNLPAGMYILQVNDADQVIRKKLIKK
ncbi:MAG TPA: T9SS type A sorting domain-containing protein, partial [Chitinophagaceae bacterium]